MDNSNNANNNLDNLENNNSFNNMVDNLDNGNNEINNNSDINDIEINNNNTSNVINNMSVNNIEKEKYSTNFNNNINNTSSAYTSSYKKNSNSNIGIYIVIIILVTLVIYLGIMLFINRFNSKVEYNDSDIVIEYSKGNIIKSELYDSMIKQYSVSILLDMVDKNILNPMYPENDEMDKNINENYDSHINYYKQYGYSEEQFLEANGFHNKEDFLDVLRLDYRRNKYLNDYIKKNLTVSEINKYYTSEVFGDINSKHILVKVGDGEDDFKDEDAKEIAIEIIDKLNDGKTFDQVREEYKDKITYEELGYLGIDAGLEDEYMKEMKNLEIDEYSKVPVKTSYGYHVIYKIDQKEKPNIDEIKEKILDVLSEQKQNEDPNLLYKTLIELRKDNNVVFKDKELKKKYDNYVDSIN